MRIAKKVLRHPVTGSLTDTQRERERERGIEVGERKEKRERTRKKEREDLIPKNGNWGGAGDGGPTWHTGRRGRLGIVLLENHTVMIRLFRSWSVCTTRERERGREREAERWMDGGREKERNNSDTNHKTILHSRNEHMRLKNT